MEKNEGKTSLCFTNNFRSFGQFFQLMVYFFNNFLFVHPRIVLGSRDTVFNKIKENFLFYKVYILVGKTITKVIDNNNIEYAI